MKTLLGMGLISLALLAGCETSKKTVTPIPTPTPTNNDPAFDHPPVAIGPGPSTPTDMGPSIPDTAPPSKTTVKAPTKTTATKVTTAKTTTGKTTTAKAAAGAKTYVVKKGDTLSSIAKAQYGNGKLYTKIIKANPGLDPNKIKPGQKINIPA